MMAGNFTNVSASWQGNTTGAEEMATSTNPLRLQTVPAGRGVKNFITTGLPQNWITKTTGFITRKASTAAETLSDGTTLGRDETTTVSSWSTEAQTPSPDDLQVNSTSFTSTLVDTAGSLAKNVTLGILESMDTTYNSSLTPANSTGSVYTGDPPHHHHHWNRTLWRGEVDHHMVDSDLHEDATPEHLNDVAYVIVVVIFYGAVLILAFVVQMKRRRNYNEVDSEYYGEYLHVKWDVLEKKRLLDKEKVRKMSCLVDAQNVAYIPEQTV